MEISTKELRDNPGRTLSRVSKGREIIVTFRGKAVAKIVPIEDTDAAASEPSDLLFGLWQDRDIEDVGAHVRALRKGRTF